MQIVINNGSFPAGLGYADFIDDFAFKANVVSKKASIKNFYDGLVNAGLWPKLYGIAFFPGTTPETQKLILNDSIDELIFTSSSTANTTNGYQPAGTGVAKTPFTPPSGVIDKFSFGAFNSTTETHQSGVPGIKSLMGIYGENSGGIATYEMELSRAWGDGDKTLGRFDVIGSNNHVYTDPYDNTKTGLLQLVKIGANYTLLDGATIIATLTPGSGYSPVGGGARKLIIGGNMGADGIYGQFSQANIQLAYWAKWDAVSEAQTFSGLVSTFLTAFHS